MFKRSTVLALLAATAPRRAAGCDGHLDHVEEQADHRSLAAADRASDKVPIWAQLGMPSQKAFIDSGGRCKTRGRSEQEREDFARGFNQWKKEKNGNSGNGNGGINNGIRGRGRSLETAAYVVPTYFHVITDNDNGDTGDVTDAQISDQMNVLNDAYRSAGIQFCLRETTRTDNAAWFSDSGDEYHTELKRGGGESLNIYTNSAGGNGILGYVHDIPRGTGWIAETADRVVLLHSTLPGGSAAPYDEGDTGTHEVGHWLGLDHTFSYGNCKKGGDGIDDTPVERSAAYGCPIGRNSCAKRAPGDDPIHNFMDYTDDACMYEFTPDQAERMEYVWTTLRTDPNDAPIDCTTAATTTTTPPAVTTTTTTLGSTPVTTIAVTTSTPVATTATTTTTVGTTSTPTTSANPVTTTVGGGGGNCVAAGEKCRGGACCSGNACSRGRCPS